MSKKRNVLGRSQEIWTKSLKANSISITCSVRKLYDKIVEILVPKNAKESSFGTGVFKYVGFSWDDDSIFVGYCPALGYGLIKFTGENSKTLFENFRTLFLNKEENKENFEYFTLNADFSLALPLEAPLTKIEINTLFEKLLKIQTIKNPKISIDKKGDFYIGGKTSANYIRIRSNLSQKADELSTTSTARVDAKIKAGVDFFKLLGNNKEVDFNVIAASLIIKKFSKIRFVGLLDNLRNTLISQHNIGKVVEVLEDDSKPTTKVGKTVLRSLTTVKNKIKSPDTMQETQVLFLKWFKSFVIELKGDSQFNDFLEQCGDSFKTNTENVSTSSAEVVTPLPSSGRGRPSRATQIETTET